MLKEAWQNYFLDTSEVVQSCQHLDWGPLAFRL